MVLASHYDGYGMVVDASLTPRLKAVTVQMFRPIVRRVVSPLAVVAAVSGVHTLIRFGGLWNAQMIALSMVIVWPLPWLLCTRQGRTEIGFRAPVSWWWMLGGPAVGLAVLGIGAAVAWALFGSGIHNWFTHHAAELGRIAGDVPAGVSAPVLFWALTIPPMIFSPLGEEFLYRGFLLRVGSARWGDRAGTVVQAAAFAIVHLAHYGLQPVQPSVIGLFLPTNFLVALSLAWMVRRSGSLWVAVVAHSIYNLGLNALVFGLLPELVGV